MSIITAPDNYYPTPKSLVEKMISKIDRYGGTSFLEPSAGTGSIVRGILEWGDIHCHRDDLSIDCIELDGELRAILKHNFSDNFYWGLKARYDSLCEKSNNHKRYLNDIERLKIGGLSESAEQTLRERTKIPVLPLTEAETRELNSIDEEIKLLSSRESVRIVHDNFLTFSTYKHYDYIIMNPPFDKGDLHLLHAIDLQQDGGGIICLLNAETIRNPHTKSRQLLQQKLNEYGAKIQYLTGEFAAAEAERKTDVEVALIEISIPRKQKDSFIFEQLRKAKEEQGHQQHEATELTTGDWITQMIDQYNLEIEAGKQLIDEYLAMAPYMLRKLENDNYNSPILDLKINSGNHEYEASDINKFVRLVRRKYWNAFFHKPEFTKLLTSELRKKYDNTVDDMINYDFTKYNIYTIMQDLMKNITGSIEGTIIALFDKLSSQYSWCPETSNNIHYYNSWATNKAWIIGKKVIIPMNGAFAYDSWYKKYDEKFSLEKVYSTLSDIEKALNYLDGGHNQDDTDLYKTLEAACAAYITKKIKCKYFNITVYKKGTCHIEFTDLELLKKLNIYGSQRKGWLPPSYGKKAYKDMTAEEKTVIDEFEGEEEYNRVMQSAKYYLSPISGSNILQIEERG